MGFGVPRSSIFPSRSMFLYDMYFAFPRSTVFPRSYASAVKLWYNGGGGGCKFCLGPNEAAWGSTTGGGGEG